MKIISKRARKIQSGSIPGLDVVEVQETSIVISSSGDVLSPADLKRIEDMFRDIRKQLEDFGQIQSP